MLNHEPETISTEGLPVMAAGVHATVYRTGGERIVKLYNPGISRGETEKEFALTREAHRLGVPAPAAYGMVKCGERFGIEFEMIRGETLGHAIAAAPEQLDGYAERYAALVRLLHGTRTRQAVFPELKSELRRKLPLLEAFCTGSDIALLDELTGLIPDSDSLIHGDLHPGNIIIRDGQLIMIDLPEMMRGSPLWDLAAIYRDLIIGPMFPSRELEESIGMKAPLIARTGQAFFRVYTGLEGKDLERYMDAMLPLYGMNTIFTIGTAEDRNEQNCAEIIPMLMTEAIRKHEDSLRAMLTENEKGE